MKAFIKISISKIFSSKGFNSILLVTALAINNTARANDCLPLAQQLVQESASLNQVADLAQLRSRLSTLTPFLEPKIASVTDQYTRIITRDATLSQVFSELLVLQVLTNERHPNRSLALGALFDLIENEQAANAAVSLARLQEIWLQFLGSRVPASQLSSRVQGVLSAPNIETLSKALGDLSFVESRELFDELVARYVADSGAATVRRSFHKGAANGVVDLGSPVGGERLVVAVSAESFEHFMKYFSGSTQFFHVHTPRQGTLLVGFQGKVGSYARLNKDFRQPAVGTILPTIVLSSIEGERMHQYLRLGTVSGSALTPWQLQGYCATGGYSSCTHWVGNIPIGDRLVSEYRFPGKIDQYASNSISADPIVDAAPRVQPLGDYQYSGDPIVAHLLPQVWTRPGAEQLADVIGLSESNLRGELANPGWVAISLTGAAPQNRVPVVFYIVNDHRAAIAPNFDPQIAAY